MKLRFAAGQITEALPEPQDTKIECELTMVT